MEYPQLDAVIIGAGLAGLACADRLVDAGLSVIVLEGGGRVGGRARTVGAPFLGGQVVETGAEWVDTVHRRMIALLARFGLELEGDGQVWTSVRRRFHDGERMWNEEELIDAHPGLAAEFDRYHELVSRPASGISNPARPQDHPDAFAVDSRSLHDAIDQADLGPLAQLFAGRDAQAEFSAEPGEVSLLFVAQQRALYRELEAVSPARSHRVRGGVSRIATALAGSLPDRCVRFGENARRIEWDATGAMVTTGRGHRYNARFVIPTCSLAALRSMTLDGPLPEIVGRAMSELGYGGATKTAVQFSGRDWPAGSVTSQRSAQRIYESSVDQRGEAGVLMAYTGGDNGRRLGGYTEDERITKISSEMRLVHADIGDQLAAVSRAWSIEGRYGGSYACYGPGQVTAFWEPLRTPIGPLILAGEHTATCTGYLEGAVESGERAADHVLARSPGAA